MQCFQFQCQTRSVRVKWNHDGKINKIIFPYMTLYDQGRFTSFISFNIVLDKECRYFFLAIPYSLSVPRDWKLHLISIPICNEFGNIRVCLMT